MIWPPLLSGSIAGGDNGCRRDDVALGGCGKGGGMRCDDGDFRFRRDIFSLSQIYSKTFFAICVVGKLSVCYKSFFGVENNSILAVFHLGLTGLYYAYNLHTKSNQIL